MPVTQSCRHHTLARNPVAHVQRCEHCRCISVHAGPVTLRLDEGSLEGLRHALNEASIALTEQAVSAPTPNARGGVA